IRYSWAYLLQRPRASDPSVVSCTVVVYNKRPLGLSLAVQPGTALAGGQPLFGEAAYNATFNLNGNSIIIDWTASTPPSARAGDWLLDATLVQTQIFDGTGTKGGPVVTGTYNSAHGFFYRVISVTPLTPTSASYEVQQPIRGFSGQPTQLPAG